MKGFETWNKTTHRCFTPRFAPPFHLCIYIHTHFQSTSSMKSLCGRLFSLRADLVSLALLLYLHMQCLLWQNHIRISLQMRHIAAAQSRFCFCFFHCRCCRLSWWLTCDSVQRFLLFGCIYRVCALSRLLSWLFSFGHRGQVVCHNMCL